MAYIVQSTDGNDGKIAVDELIERRCNIRKADIIGAWNLLRELKILTPEQDDQDYRLTGIKEAKIPDFLIIWMRKKTRVSPVGHRSVRVAAQVMALHGKVTNRVCGSIIWKERKKMPAPKSRLPPARVSDLLQGKQFLQNFKVEEANPTHIQFRLDFKPPLQPGSIVDYGFYVWNRNYYSRSRSEAIQLYKDEWIREGLGVSGPAIEASIVVKLPVGYTYQDCHLEKGTAPSVGGPASPGEILPGLKHDEKTLSATLHEPSPGNYFVCWIPPE